MLDDRKLRVAIIGCGRIAGGYDKEIKSQAVHTHAGAYQLHDLTKLIAVVDKDIQQAKKFSEHWGCPKIYKDSATMLATESPDIVSICTPSHTHAKLLEMCLDFSNIKAVWTEKPLATDVGIAKKIVAAYKEKDITLAVNYQRRWDPEMQRIKNAISQGKLGIIQKVLMLYSKGIVNNGSHAVDLLIDWFGPKYELQVFGKHIDFLPDDPTVDARLTLGGIPIYLTGVDARQYGVFEIHIFGTLGRVNLMNFGREIEWFQKVVSQDFDGYQELKLQKVNKSESDQRMNLVLKEIVQAIFSHQAVRSNGETALVTLEVCAELVELSKKY